MTFSMLRRQALSICFKYPNLFCIIFLLTHLSVSEALALCSKDIFGIPGYRDCMNALSAVPTDQNAQFFVEQQFREASTDADWAGFVDPRPWPYRKEIVQIPKWWSQGNNADAS